ncbi:uncharacterized protein LOC101859741 [Aplysia californica]|uniref:Uncharacterized protein LOC101859741 n=1 Tax=Aplysia californica TaxID=6500 RepID=A0ABM1W1V1_APLCA|nr:uncharacterized protein LOC101859741 [Aplysia californica]
MVLQVLFVVIPVVDSGQFTAHLSWWPAHKCQIYESFEKSFRTRLFTDVFALFAALRREGPATPTGSTDSPQKLFPHHSVTGNSQRVYRKRIINRLFHLDDLTIPDLDHDAVTVREMSPADVVHMSTDTAVMHKLFPQGRIFAHSMYLRLVEENLPELISDNAAIFASTTDASGGTQMSPGTQTLGCADGRRLSDADISGIDMISTAYHNMAAIGLQYEMDIQSPSGLRSLPAHLRHHVRAIRQLGAPSGVVMVTISEGLDEAAVEACLATYGLTKHLAHAERHILYFVYRL